MTKYNQDFRMKSGDDRILRYTCVDDDDVSPLDFTLGALKFGMTPLKNFDGMPSSISKSSGSGISIEGSPTLGIALVDLDPADSDGLKGDFVAELEYVDGAGRLSTLATGIAKVVADIKFP
jgi:hypothetical protein